MGKIEDLFLQEALELINDSDVKLGTFTRYTLRSYAEEYSKKIKDDPETAKRMLQKIQKAIAKILNER